MNASDITLYYVSEDDKPYLTLNLSHIYQYQFQVTGTKQEVLRWSVAGEGKTYFRADDKGLLTAGQRTKRIIGIGRRRNAAI